jgi:hypothetical protein
MAIPTHVQRHLEALGRWNTDGISRKAQMRACKCGQPVLTALDHDRTAMVAKCDPTPLNVLGELTALMAGHDTWRLSWNYDHWEIDARDQLNIAAHPAGTKPGVEILRGHLCHSPPIAEEHSRPPIRVKKKESEKKNDEPDF